MDRRNLAIGSALFFVGFVVVAVAKFEFVSIQSADEQILVLVNHMDFGIANGLLVAASLYGREYFWGLLVVVMVLLGDRQTKRAALQLGAIFLAGVFVGDLLKAVLIWPRPNPASLGITDRVALDTDSSFPSGHAIIVSAGAAYSWVAFRRKWIAGFLWLEAALVCLSRIFVGVHYPSDVVGGAFIGFSLALGAFAIEESYLAAVFDRVSAWLVRVFRDGPLRL